MTHLIYEKVQLPTIKSYVSAVKSILGNEDIEINDNHIKLNSLIKACKVQNDVLTVRLPIHSGLKNMILDRIQDYYMEHSQPYLAKMYRAIVSTGYHGLLRVGELTTGAHPILCCNVITAKNKRKIQIILRSSKTHSESDLPQKITIVSVDRMDTAINYCPFKLINEYIEVRPKYLTDEEHFFVFSDRHPVKSAQLRRVLKASIKAIGLNQDL